MREDQLNSVARFLGFDDFKGFLADLEDKKDPQLLSLIGNYYSYVRMNTHDEDGLVLRSPVRIFKKKDGKIWLELKGASHTFSGEVKNRGGCLYILLEAKEGKAFHHVYKVGNRKSPKVLQGIFSGVTTAFDPIGGRVVLIWSETEYEALTTAKLEIETLKKSTITGESKLAAYFRDYLNNNLKPNRSASFGIEDL